MLAFTVWYLIFNAFSSSEKWSTALFKYDFSVKSPTLLMMFRGMEAGIAEEWVWRFAIGTLLFVAFKNAKHTIFRKHFIEWTVGTVGVLFGLWHFDNFLGGQNLLGTVDQMLSAMAAGWLFMALYLYTNNLLSAMLFHFSNDALAFIASGTTMMSKPDAFEWESTIIQVVIFGLIAAFILTGKRRQVVAENVASITKVHAEVNR